MATLSKTAFEAKYTDNTTGIFADNTTQAIGADDMREFADDIADSFAVSGGLNWIVVQIGDWNMDTTSSKNVAHGLPDYKKIRSLTAIIRDDSDTVYTSITGADTLFPNYGALETNGSTNIALSRVNLGYFDSNSYDSTSFNRGWITIGYVN